MMTDDNTEMDDLQPAHYFELMDRAHVATLYLEAALGDHPALRQHPEFKRLYDAAIESLAALYQAVGAHPKTFQ